MNTVGVIAEYNPFHKGHLYQIEEIRRRTGADYIIIAMSGDFLQRGTPAIIDKYTRTKMALSCGADLVLELPCLWAVSSAEDFAAAGVTLLEKTGCVDMLCFGAEHHELTLLETIADILAEEPEDFSRRLGDHLREGMPFPAARSLALTEYIASEALSETAAGLLANDPDSAAGSAHIPDLLACPNNILALEYLKAIRRRNNTLTPLLISRRGAGYHEEDIRHPMASATAIRQALTGTQSWADSAGLDAMPDAAADILRDCRREYPYTDPDDFSAQLAYLLLSLSRQQLAQYQDCNTELAGRIKSLLPEFHSLEQFSGILKSRNLTHTRISRSLCHILLGLTQEDYALGRSLDYAPYLRILGFRREAAPLLTRLDACAQAPVISKLADASSILPEDAAKLLSHDIFAADLYEQNLARRAKKTARSEYSRGLVII
ncbi:MAG: nucleotidyltransferase family protein [Lachnospiraceae bacterium]|nr:nucleotidyltransferase family protein [Lachnospiraceae bacterium]